MVIQCQVQQGHATGALARPNGWRRPGDRMSLQFDEAVLRGRRRQIDPMPRRHCVGLRKLKRRVIARANRDTQGFVPLEQDRQVDSSRRRHRAARANNGLRQVVQPALPPMRSANHTACCCHNSPMGPVGGVTASHGTARRSIGVGCSASGVARHFGERLRSSTSDGDSVRFSRASRVSSRRNAPASGVKPVFDRASVQAEPCRAADRSALASTVPGFRFQRAASPRGQRRRSRRHRSTCGGVQRRLRG